MKHRRRKPCNCAKCRRRAVVAGPGGGVPDEVHRNAAEVVKSAFRMLHGREPSIGELLYSLAVGWGESNYGRAAYKDANGAPITGTNNWGAVQAGGNWSGATFEAVDSSPGKGGQKTYVTRFRKYATPEEGAADLIKMITTNRPVVWAVMKANGSRFQFSDAMRRSRYYEGFCAKAAKAGKPPAPGGIPKKPEQFDCHAEAIAGHVALMSRGLEAAAKALGVEPPPMGDPSQITPFGADMSAESFAPGASAAGGFGAKFRAFVDAIALAVGRALKGGSQ